MNNTLLEVERAILHYKNQAIEAGVAPENVEAVAMVQAMQILHFTNGIEKRHNQLESIPTIPLTFKEWAANFDISSHVDYFLAVATYLFDTKKQNIVDTDDILQLYTRARWEKPHNPADVFYKGAKRSFFTDEGVEPSESGLKKWRLTGTGLNYFYSLRKETQDE